MSPGASGSSPTRDWDAGTYDRVSAPQVEWGRELIERLRPADGEVVLDAGCGSGRVSRLLLERLPRGRLIAVDGSASMAAYARSELGEQATVLCADLLELELDDPVDAVFSNATFHWIKDHAALFRRIAGWLRAGGRLEAQCGGAGNVAAFVELATAIAAEPPFAEHFAGFEDPHHFATPRETEGRLTAAGLTDVRCWLEPRRVSPPEPRSFLRAVGLAPYLEELPAKLHEPFVDAVFARFAADPVLDYVRLNISARLPGSGA